MFIFEIKLFPGRVVHKFYVKIRREMLSSCFNLNKVLEFSFVMFFCMNDVFKLDARMKTQCS